MKCWIPLLLAAVVGGAAVADEAKIQTSMGDIVIALDAEQAPKTVANFIAYAKSGHFNGTVVYRVVPGFVVQMGSVDAKGHGRKLRAPIPLETAGGLKNVRGAVAMARGDKTASAQAEFFIDLADNAPLDPKLQDAPNTSGYAVFGQVVGGMEVADAIAKVPLGGGVGPFPDAMPKTPVKILKVSIGHFAPPPASPPQTVSPAQDAAVPPSP
jgi:cyclophilin family peptidyl-prolyl cis-trans isomerase